MAFDALLIDDFSGGLDLVSSLSRIPPSFTPDARNFRLATFGGIEKVLGYSAFATLGADGHDLTYYEQRDGSPKCLIAATSTKWQKVASDGTVTDIRTSMTANTETTFVQHEDYLYGLDRANNLGRWNGTDPTATAFAPGVNTGPKLGIILGIWSNRMWVSPATGMRVEFSAAETFTGTGSWPVANYVELGGPGTSDTIVGGMPTPDGLLVFCKHSTYLIYDSATGANRLVDSERGCSSRKSLARVGDVVYGVCGDGIFATRGAGMDLVSGRVAPIFEKGSPDVSSAAGVAWFDSYIAALAREESYNDLSLEMYAPTGSLMAFDYPAHAWTKGELTGIQTEAFFIDASDKTKIRRAFDGGTFAGADIACYYETPLNPLGDETHLKRLRRVRVVGRGTLAVAVRADHAVSNIDTDGLEFPSAGGAVWNTSGWDEDNWAGYQIFEGWAHLSARGRRLSLRISESSADVAPARDAIGQSVRDSTGGAGVYLIEVSYSRSSKRRQL